MRFQSLAYAALAASIASAQQLNLTAALGSNPDVSLLNSLLGANPELVSTLSNATNITILAPSNQALGALSNSTGNVTASSDYISALL